MAKIVRSIRLDEDLFKKVGKLALLNGYRSASGIIEKALELCIQLQGDLDNKDDLNNTIKLNLEKEAVKMTRVVSTTTLDEDLLKKTRAFAHANGYKGANDIIEKALKLYFELQNQLDGNMDLDNIINIIYTCSQSKKVKIFEKKLPNGKYQIVTISNKHTCLDYVDKRINIDGVSDIEKLIDDGYYSILET